MSAEVEIHRLWGGGTVELTFEGRWAYLGYRSLDLDELRRSAAEDDARAAEAAYRARRTRALADELERRNAEARCRRDGVRGLSEDAPRPPAGCRAGGSVETPRPRPPSTPTGTPGCSRGMGSEDFGSAIQNG